MRMYHGGLFSYYGVWSHANVEDLEKQEVQTSLTGLKGNVHVMNAAAAAWAVENGVTSGTTFSPDSTCTRGRIVTFLNRDPAGRNDGRPLPLA